MCTDLHNTESILGVNDEHNWLYVGELEHSIIGTLKKHNVNTAMEIAIQ